MKKLPKFSEERELAQSLKSISALYAYEKLEIGAAIRRQRKKLGLKQQTLAGAVKTAQSVIARIESGEQNLTLKSLVTIALALGKKISVKFL